MRLQDHIDFTTLQWVKPELDETLARARESLEAHVENPADRDAMRSCAENLHQVQGTLRMVELYGAALVAEEMESLANALREGGVSQTDDAYAALMRALMQLPDYLERLSSGHRDVPVVLLPLLNDLRASHGQQALHESALFTPNLEVNLPAQAPPPVRELVRERQKQDVTTLRLRFQQQLLSWFRNQDADHQLGGMIQTLDATTGACQTIPGRRLWWIAAGVLEGVQQGVLRGQTNEVRQLIGRVDRSMRQLVDSGETSLRGTDADDLANKLLYIVAQAKQGSPRMELVSKTYALQELLPQEEEMEHARGSLAGHNRALLDSVSRAIKDDLLRVKESLDLFLRQPDGDPAQLAAQAEVLDRVGDTLGMLALTVPRRVVSEQRRVLEDIANRTRACDEEQLLDVAGALLYVEASLDDHIESLGTEGEITPDLSGGATSMLPRSEARHILATLMHEATGNTAKAKEAIVAYVESGWHANELTHVSALMDEVAGAMRMLSAERPAELAEGIGRFVGNELLVDRRVPNAGQMEQLADALAALEYYLEATREHRGGLDHILDVAEHSLGKLGYWPVPAARFAEPVAEVADDAAEPSLAASLAGAPALSESVSLAHGDSLADLIVGGTAAPATVEHDVAGLRLTDTQRTTPQEAVATGDEWVEIEEEIEEEVPVMTGGAQMDAAFQAGTAGIDDDIRDIFLEEMQEEVDNLQISTKAWLADSAHIDLLVPIRRSFHTLKGSGRLVGAHLLGEFAWKVENMLNRVLDQTIQPHDGVKLVISGAVDALPQLRTSLQGGAAPTAPIVAIMETADRIAAGQADARIQHVASATETVRRTVRRRVLRSTLAAIPAATLAGVATQSTIEAPATGSVMPPIDPVLLEILRSEVAQYLQTIRLALGRAGGELRVDDSLLRAVHTLNGAIAMVDIPLLTQLLSPLESLLKRLRAAGKPLSIEGVGLLMQSADSVDHVMAQFDGPSALLPNLDTLIQRITELRDSQPEPQVAHVLFEPQGEDLAASVAHAGVDAEHDPLGASLDAALSHVTGTAPKADAPLAGSDDTYADELLAALGSFEPDAAAPVTPSSPAHFGASPVVSTSSEEDELAAAYRSLLGETGATSNGADDAFLAPPADIEVEELSFDDLAVGVPGPEQTDDIHAFLLDEPVPGANRFEAPTFDEPVHHDEPVPPVHEPLSFEEPVFAESKPVEHSFEMPAFADHDSIKHTFVEPTVVEPTLVEPAVVEPVAPKPLSFEIEKPAPVEAFVAPVPPAAAAAPVAAVEPPASSPAAGVNVLSPSQIDPDLLEIFIEEAREILDHSDSMLAQWRGNPGATEHSVAELQRDLHTLKGGARIAGMVPVGDLTHAIETLLEKQFHTQRARVPGLIAALESGFDLLNSLVQRVSQGKVIEYPQAMITRFESLAHGDEAAVAAPAEAPVVEHAAPVAAESHEAPAQPSDDTAEEAFTALVGSQEQIRVRAELLDTLVNHAGEVSIYRSRLEQQVAGYRFNLIELDQTVQRLRSQLRMLEIETEAQIIARFQRENREAGSLGSFDPLELDRFSQLQQYSRALAESVSDLVSIQNMLDELTRQAETLLIHQSRVSADLQEGLLRTRMLQFDTMVPNLRRTLRQAAQEEGKNVQLFVDGAHGEMDRNLLDHIKAPFEHMLRNAVAHGIEKPEDRRKAGKSPDGAVRIRVAREATEVVIRVSDDGRGLNREAIRKRGVERGLVRADARLSDDQILQLITLPGFSTASTVTQLAGRGVGMDVVVNEIKQLGGSLAIESTEGQGTTFILRLPFTLAVTQAILVRMGETNYAIPMTSVQGVARISPEELTARMAEPEPVFSYANDHYGIHDLSELLGLPNNGYQGEDDLPPLLLSRAGDLRAAIRIDGVIGSREIVVKSVGPQISSVPGILGATIMGDGSVLVILDLPPLVRHAIARRQERLEQGLSAVAPVVLEEAATKPLVMVVDDSITMRKVTGRVLERHEFEVETAKDGLDAVEKLVERVPDLMLLDIEMPRMDGYELATHMKADPRLRNVPIIMITSRTGDKHRQRAFDIGVDRYLGKPYQEAELLAQINEVLAQRKAATHG